MPIPKQAARKLIEIANRVEAVQDGRIHIEKINYPFLFVEKAEVHANRRRFVRVRGCRRLFIS